MTLNPILTEDAEDRYKEQRTLPIGDIPAGDCDVLRRLAARKMEIGSLPIQKERRAMWTRLNRLQKVKPLVWIEEIPWHEMNYDDELTLQTEHPFCQAMETLLRRELYQWDHMQADMIVQPVFYCQLVVHDTGFGIDEDVDVVRTDETSDVVSRHFHQQINDESDIEKIRMPVVTYDAEATEERFQTLVDIFGDIIPVVKRGQPGFWFAPWDELIRWWTVEGAMIDLVDRPQLVEAAMDRLVAAYLTRLDQYVAQNLLALNNNNTRIGSGAYGCTDELPQPDYDPEHVRPLDLWGCGTAQIFSDVSPRMHKRFALQYERRWMDQFGLTYYGCCEPLDIKMDILREVPNLRKISMSPWVDLRRGAKELQTDYVFSRKPNPAIFAEEIFKADKARALLREMLEITSECRVEIIMKDISTVLYKPQHLWQWAQIATEETARYA